MHQNTCVRNPDESFCLQENQDETESTTRSVINGEENSMPEVCEHKTSDVVKETVAVSSPFGQQSQTQDAAIEIPPEEQGLEPKFYYSPLSLKEEDNFDRDGTVWTSF